MHAAFEPLRDRGHAVQPLAARGIEVDPGSRLDLLLAWMAGQDFARVSAGEPGLLSQVEHIVIDAHRRLYESEGREWSRPIAYRWLRFEDPMPVVRLQEGVRELVKRGGSFNPDAVEKACMDAGKDGFAY